MTKTTTKQIYILTFTMLFCKLSLANPVVLEVKTKNIVVDGKAKKVYTIEQPNGTWGYYGYKSESFNVIVKNTLNESTVIHWHGLIVPNNQDGVELTQKLIPPHSEYKYNFPLIQSGTYWMHSHFGLQEQNFAEAPLIIYDNKKYVNKNDIVLMLQDFSFKSPKQIMKSLNDGNNMTHDMHNMNMGKIKHESMVMDKMQMDLNDVKYDAYLVNYKALNNPQVNYVTPNSVIRLRFINAASMSNFWINLGNLQGKLIAMDGDNIKPIISNKFQIGMGNRLDILIKIPSKLGNFPIYVIAEGTKMQTGIILINSRKIKPQKLNSVSKIKYPALNYTQELELTTLDKNYDMPPENTNEQKIKLVLNGTMNPYEWTINGQKWPNITPISVNIGKYVVADIINNSNMSHPIHLHGYKFKIVKINGKPINGAIQDTILVQPHTNVEVAFFVNNHGKWLFHCHSLYHMMAGMMTYIETKAKD